MVPLGYSLVPGLNLTSWSHIDPHPGWFIRAFILVSSRLEIVAFLHLGMNVLAIFVYQTRPPFTVGTFVTFDPVTQIGTILALHSVFLLIINIICAYETEGGLQESLLKFVLDFEYDFQQVVYFFVGFFFQGSTCLVAGFIS